MRYKIYVFDENLGDFRYHSSHEDLDAALQHIRSLLEEGVSIDVEVWDK